MTRFGFPRVATSLALVLTLGLAGGCSSKPPAASPDMNAEALREVNDMLHAASGRGKAPTKLADLTRQHNMFPVGYEAVKSGEVVVLWGTPVQDEGELGKHEQVIAYEKKAPTEGGFVLFSAGTIKRMSAADLTAAAPKAASK